MSKVYRFDPAHLFFVFDPEQGERAYFDNAEERDRFAKDTIAEYLSDGLWGDGVDDIHVGVVTGCAQKANWVKRPNDLDDDGCDGGGDYWSPDVDEKFNIEIGVAEMAKVVLES